MFEPPGSRKSPRLSRGLASQLQYRPPRRAGRPSIAIVAMALFHASSLVAAASKITTPQAPSAESLQALIDQAAADDPGLPGVLLAVYSPSHGLDWQGASGHFAIGSARRLDPAQPFRLASVTKAYTAATVLRLVEQGRLVLTESIDGRISSDTSTLLRQGGYDPQKILVIHLLSHTSGLVDHGSSKAFIGRLATEGHHHWTRHEQIALAMTLGPAWGAPGQAYHYSDTGYIILGEIIERVTGRTLAQAFHDELDYHRMGLVSTWFETLEPVPSGALDRAHQYMDTDGIDATDFDPSFDLYGGGGLVSTTRDLTRFFRALILGDPFANRSTLAAGLAVPDVRRDEHDAAYGVMLPTIAFGPHLCWGKAGAWGSVGLYCPDIDLAVGLSVNRIHSKAPAKLLIDLAKLIDKAWSVPVSDEWPFHPFARLDPTSR